MVEWKNFKESCQLYTKEFQESSNDLGNLISSQRNLLVKRCPTNDTIFTNDNDNALDIFTANLELYCDNGHYISYLPRTVYLSYILGVPIIGNIHKRSALFILSSFLCFRWSLKVYTFGCKLLVFWATTTDFESKLEIVGFQLTAFIL